jgi:hypothetical protein
VFGYEAGSVSVFGIYNKFMVSVMDLQFFVLYFYLYPLYNPISTIREALLACFPGIHHLMCYFHVKQACQVKLRGKRMHEQKEVLRGIDKLHATTSTSEYNDLYRVTYRKWCDRYSSFAYYFEQQWNSGTAFNQWKVYLYRS